MVSAINTLSSLSETLGYRKALSFQAHQGKLIRAWDYSHQLWDERGKHAVSNIRTVDTTSSHSPAMKRSLMWRLQRSLKLLVPAIRIYRQKRSFFLIRVFNLAAGTDW